MGELDRSFSALTDLRREMNRVFSDFERGWGLEALPRLNVAARTAWPRVSLQDAGTDLRLRAEVPGLTEKDLHLTVEQGSLTIRGQRQPDAPEGYAVHRQERGALTFARTFALPCRIQTDKVTAHLSHGVLEMTLPKVAEEQPRQIQVSVS